MRPRQLQYTNSALWVLRLSTKKWIFLLGATGSGAEAMAISTFWHPMAVNYTRQVNGVKLVDILFSLLSLCLSVCLSVCVSVRTQSSLQHCAFLSQRISYLPHATHLPPKAIHLADICTLWAHSSYFEHRQARSLRLGWAQAPTPKRRLRPLPH